MNAIQTERLTKRFRRVKGYRDLAFYRWQPQTDVAVEAVSLEVHQGELFGLLGENGAGKTTLIRMLSTTLLPTEGTANVAGHDVVREPHAVRRLIGLVSGDERSFYWRLTGRQNLRYFAALYHVPRSTVTRRIAKLLETLELGAYADRRFDNLSTGIRQRFAIARGLLMEPRILFLDEPTRALDPMAADGVRRYVRDHVVADLGCTVVLATHTLSEAEAICDRVAIMHGGKIIETGAIDELRTRATLATVLELTLTGFSSRLRDVICELPDVMGVEVHDEGGRARLSVRLGEQDGAMTHVLRAILDSGSSVVTCETRRPSLDDIYRAAHGLA